MRTFGDVAVGPVSSNCLQAPTHYKTGISISSGAMHGAAFLGMLKALNEAGFLQDVKAMAGCSIGAMITAVVQSHVNRALLEDGHFNNQQYHYAKGIEKAHHLLRRAAFHGGFLQFATNGSSHDHKIIEQQARWHNLWCNLSPLFKMMSDAIPDPINVWNLSKLPHYIDPDAVSKGPIDTYDGLAELMPNGKVEGHVLHNDVSTRAVSASCALFKPMEYQGKLFSDGAKYRAAPCVPLIEAGCERLIMIGESDMEGRAPLARHQRQAMIAEGKSTHATPYFQGHALRLSRQFPDVEILYAGVPLPNSEQSRGNVCISHFESLYRQGYEAGEAFVAAYQAQLVTSNKNNNDRVLAAE